jgi:hypothetical protein
VPGALRYARHGGVLASLALCAATVGALLGNRAHAAVMHGVGSSGSPVVQQEKDPRGTFRISGSVGGLYPGNTAKLVLTVTNPEAYAIVVETISTTVSSPGAGCGASYLVVTSFSGHLSVPAHGSASVSVPVTLGHAAPDACQGLVFPLQYTGSGSKA